MRGSLKWTGYRRTPHVATIREVLAIIDADEAEREKNKKGS